MSTTAIAVQVARISAASSSNSSYLLAPTGDEAVQGVDNGTANGLKLPKAHAQFEQLWSQTLSDYTKKTDIDLSNHPLADVLSGLQSPEDICDIFQARIKRFRHDDSRWGRLRNYYVKPIVDALLIINDTLGDAAGASAVIPGGKVIFVAFGALLAATKGVSNRYDALVSLLQEVEFSIRSIHLRTSNTTSLGDLSMSIASLILAHVLDVFALATKFFSTTDRSCARLFHYGQSLANRTDMQEALKRLRVLTELESRAILSETRVDADICRNIAVDLREKLSMMVSTHERDSMSLAIVDRVVNSISQRLTAIQNELRQVLTAQEEANISVLLGRLDRVDHADLDAQRRMGCLQGTRVDVLQSLRVWSQTTSSPCIYWLNGMAGTGKSTIARSFARQLQKAGALGGSYFCSRESLAALSDTQRIIPTLAGALAGFDVQYEVALLSVLKQYSFGARPSSWTLKLQVERLFVEPFTRFMRRMTTSPTPVLVIDALDEAEDATVGDLLDALVSVARKLPVKFFLTSRPEKHIRRRFDSRVLYDTLKLHNIEAMVVKADIRRYIKYRFREILERFKGYTTFPKHWPSDSDTESLVSLSGSLFIYAFTTTEYVGGKNPVKRLEDVLHVGHQSLSTVNPLNDLDRIYQFILSSATSHGTRDELNLTRRILSAILASRESLDMITLAWFLKLEVYEIRTALDELHAVINIPRDDDGEALSTLHASFGDYLTDSNRAHKDMHISVEDGHNDLASACFTAMLSDDLHFSISGALTSYLPNSEQNLNVIPSHIAHACGHWTEHVLGIRSPSKSIIDKMEEFFLSKLLFWLECCSALATPSGSIEPIVAG
ncbi:unnamed protein product [Peniophora sp. CBMAI 1063]|nr:unnamed protein product [Peniophora sp. CBMAI 1063]